MTRGRLAVHAHLYQPLRVDPFSGRVPADPSAAPFHDWNTRIDAECYRPLAERGTLANVSFDVGPTLASWLETEAPQTYRGLIAVDRAAGGRGSAIAQSFHHSILPLASAADRRTEIRWGLTDFRHRFGREPDGLWLPETAVDLPTLRALVDEGIRYTILAPWQAAETALDTRRPYRVDLGGGRSIVVAFYDASLSAAVSFEPSATSDADRFARERVAIRLASAPAGGGPAPLAVIATDGELYGHHQQFRDLFLHRLVTPDPARADRGFDVVELASELVGSAAETLPIARIAERTSWSCHHGIARWTHECPDAADGRWKGPLRSALERLAGGIDALTEAIAAKLGGSPDPWVARDAYAGVVIGAETAEAFAERWVSDASDRARFMELMEAQRWRLAMFSSDAWFWEDPARPETRQVLRFAARAARILDGMDGGQLERRLVADLGLLVSPGRGLDGAAVYRHALSEVGQPGPA
ncbi:MAG TPA: DUF3536 domain-containing protein [Candidatus Limnocylindrales bacterium]|jgi:hypothetical protein